MSINVSDTPSHTFPCHDQQTAPTQAAAQKRAWRLTTLRGKTLVIVAATLLSLLVIIYIPLRVFLLGSFIDLERQMLRTDVERALSALQSEVQLLDAFNASYSVWDDSYNFVTNPDQSYIDKNYYDQFFIDNRLNLVAVTDLSGRLVYSKVFDLATQREAPIPQRFQQLAPSDPLINNIAATSATGIVLLPEGPMLIASHSITTSDGEGDPDGALLMGRYLNDAEVRYLAENTHLDLSVGPRETLNPAKGTATTYPATTTKPGVMIVPLDEQTIAGYASIDDLDHADTLMLRVTTPRSVYAQGWIGINSFMVSLLIAGLVFGAIMLALIERFVLSRLAALNASVQRIGAQNNLSERVVIEGEDELAQLTLSINGMLAAIEHAQIDRQQAARVREKMLLQEEALRAKREFLSVVSHELRTPLTPIAGYVDLMLIGEGGDLTDDQRELLTIIRSNTTRMATLVEDLLEIGRIEANRVALHFAPVDLGGAVDEAIKLFQPQIEQKQMALVRDLAPALPPVEADAKRISQVLINLISNAIKYSYSAGHITVRAFQPEAAHVAVQIEDTGVGLTPEQMDRLFTPFYRADSPLRETVSGSGLGLTIAKSFVELHGGTITVRSQPGVGSVFTVTLPVRQPAQPAPDQPDQE